MVDEIGRLGDDPIVVLAGCCPNKLVGLLGHLRPGHRHPAGEQASGVRSFGIAPLAGGDHLFEAREHLTALST